MKCPDCNNIMIEHGGELYKTFHCKSCKTGTQYAADDGNIFRLISWSTKNRPVNELEELEKCKLCLTEINIDVDTHIVFIEPEDKGGNKEYFCQKCWNNLAENPL